MKPIQLIEILVLTLLCLGAVYTMYLIFRDPINMFKSFLRYLKDYNVRLKIVSSPLWGVFWMLDKQFSLNIFYEDIEETSIKSAINFDDFKKYIIINIEDFSTLENRLSTERYFKKSIDMSSIAGITNYQGQTIILLNDRISWHDCIALFRAISIIAQDLNLYSTKLVFIEYSSIDKSFFCMEKDGYSLMLVGKTYSNKKIYLKFDDNANIYYNSNIDYFPNFRFKRFIKNVDKLIFESSDNLTIKK